MSSVPESKFCVVKFIEDENVDVIPSSWLMNTKEAKWPVGKSTFQMSQLIRGCATAEENWSTVPVKIYCFKKTFSKANEAAVRAQETSNIGSDSSYSDKISRKRKKKMPAKYCSSTDEEAVEELLMQKRAKKFPIPHLSSYIASDNRNSNSMDNEKFKTCNQPSSTQAISDQPLNCNLVSPEESNLENSGSLINIAKVADKPKKDSASVVVAMLQRLFKEIEKLNANVKELTEKQAEMTEELRLLQGDSRSDLVMANFKLPSDIQLPVQTEEQLIYLNNRLQTDEKFQISLTKYLHARSYGKTASAFLLCVTKQVLSRNVALMYSRLGRKGKKSFEQLKDLFNTILAATAIRHNIEREVLAEKFGKILAQSGDWDGNRQKILKELCINSLTFTEDL